MARKAKKREPINIAEVFGQEVARDFKRRVHALFEQLEREGCFGDHQERRGHVIPFPKGHRKA